MRGLDPMYTEVDDHVIEFSDISKVTLRFQKFIWKLLLQKWE